jgi:hypothetical protein
VIPTKRLKSATAFLSAAVATSRSLGVTVARVMTDNGCCYKAFAFARAYTFAFATKGSSSTHPNQALHAPDH